MRELSDIQLIRLAKAMFEYNDNHYSQLYWEGIDNIVHCICKEDLIFIYSEWKKLDPEQDVSDEYLVEWSNKFRIIKI